MSCLAYVPFAQPLPVEGIWLLLLMLPMVLGIAIVYKALHLDDLRRLPRESAIFAAQIALFMAGAAGALWLLTVVA